MQLVSFSDYHDRKAGGNKGQASMSLRNTFLAPSPEKLGLSHEGGTLGPWEFSAPLLRCKQSIDEVSRQVITLDYDLSMEETLRQITPGRIPGLNCFS